MTIAQALADEAELPLRRTIDLDEIVDDARRRACPSPSPSRTRSSSCARTTALVHVVCADPFDTQALDDLRVLFGKPVEAARARPASESSDAINRVYEREAGGGELETDDDSADEEAVERHPRLRRRGARHPLGQLALPAGDEGARERHPHRAGREGGHRPLPHRRRALRRAARAARVHEQHRQPHQDRELAQHRREAPAAGRPHHEEDRRQELRHPRQHHPDEPRLRADRHASPRTSRASCSTCRTSASARATTR